MQFLVPQFIDVEPKIFGPISVRQFIIMAVGGGLMYLTFTLFRLVIFIPIALVLAALTFGFAFVKINTQPLHVFLLSYTRTARKPKVKVWQKVLAPFKTKTKKEKEEEAKSEVVGPPPEKAADLARLEELTLILDTGGTYRGEEERPLILPQQTKLPTKDTKPTNQGGSTGPKPANP